jgi:hypothetical protein
MNVPSILNKYKWHRVKVRGSDPFRDDSKNEIEACDCIYFS